MSRTAFGILDPVSQGFADPGGIAICPGCFDQSSASTPIARQGQTFASGCVAGRAFGRDQAKEGHQLPRRIEPAHIADFGGKGHSDQERCLRGYGTTQFLSNQTFRNGEQAAVAVDIVALMDALKIEEATFAGFDWGARTGDTIAAL